MGISQLCHNSCHSLLSRISQPANKSPRWRRFPFLEATELVGTSCTQPIPGCVGSAGSSSPRPHNVTVTPTPEPQGCSCPLLACSPPQPAADEPTVSEVREGPEKKLCRSLYALYITQVFLHGPDGVSSLWHHFPRHASS